LQRVLVADSHQDCRESLAELLAMDGDLVAQAASFEEVLQAMDAEDFDFLLVDCRLDGASAFLLDGLGQRCRGRLAITVTSTDDPAVGRFTAAGVAVLPKPLDHQLLRKLIDCPLLRLVMLCAEQGFRPQLKVDWLPQPATRTGAAAGEVHGSQAPGAR